MYGQPQPTCTMADMAAEWTQMADTTILPDGDALSFEQTLRNVACAGLQQLCMLDSWWLSQKPQAPELDSTGVVDGGTDSNGSNSSSASAAHAQPGDACDDMTQPSWLPVEMLDGAVPLAPVALPG